MDQSLFTTLLNSALSPTHAFFHCAPIYREGELRKTLEHIVGYNALTAQEGIEGGGANVRNPRHVLYNEISPGGPISRRRSYAKSSKIVSTR